MIPGSKKNIFKNKKERFFEPWEHNGYHIRDMAQIFLQILTFSNTEI